MAKKLPPRDAIIIGLGWTGSILAHELCEAGLSVAAIERGPWRDPTAEFTPTIAQDELRFRIRHDLFLRPSQTSLTFRNNLDQTALPVRTWGAFMLGNGAGGGGLHRNAETWRFLPSDFALKSHLTQRYGASFLPADMTIQDWGITYDDLETPFGTLLAPNITPDPETGIGAWTDDEFVSSLTKGTGRNGTHLYPAMPYTYMTRVTRDDALAIRAYLNTIPAVRNPVQPTSCRFPSMCAPASSGGMRSISDPANSNRWPARALPGTAVPISSRASRIAAFAIRQECGGR